MDAMGLPPEEETPVTMSSLTDYFKTTAERVKLDDLKEQALRNAYISGSGVLYTYWDDRIQTGLYADESGTTPITGDIACEVLDIENVYFGDPNLYELQEQPYILIAQRKSVKELRREARRNGGRYPISRPSNQTGIPDIWRGPLGRRAGGNPEGHGDNQVLEGMGQGTAPAVSWRLWWLRARQSARNGTPNSVCTRCRYSVGSGGGIVPMGRVRSPISSRTRLRSTA